MTVEELKAKHKRLKGIDGGSFLRSAAYKVFGSTSHKYKFNPPLSDREVIEFERKNRIELPEDYRKFITLIGNGGSGPAYGLLRVSDWNIELDIVSDSFLSIPFPHTKKWNIERHFDMNADNVYGSEEFIRWEEEYYSNKHITGSIRICHYGCAIYYILVVSGSEKGNVWVDDRANDEGIYPAPSKRLGRLSFVEWFDEWLNESLKQFT